MSRKICKRRQQNMKWRSLITIVFRYFSFFLSCSYLSFPFFFPYQWSRGYKHKNHEVNVFQVPSFFIFLLYFFFGNYQKVWKNAKKNKMKNINNIVIFYSILHCQSKGRSRASSICLDFLFIFLLLTKKRKACKINGWHYLLFFSCSFLFILYTSHHFKNKSIKSKWWEEISIERKVRNYLREIYTYECR